VTRRFNGEFDSGIDFAVRVLQAHMQPAIERWKVGDEWLPFHPSASHVPPGYRDGWNAAYEAAIKELDELRTLLRETLPFAQWDGRMGLVARIEAALAAQKAEGRG
jgi:hypothetical protein